MEDIKEWSENIKNDLSIEQVYDLLMSFGGDPILKGDMIICRTICHGGHSHKLYYYENTKLFKCYTDCLDSFDIYELIIKLNKINGVEISLFQAISFIINFYGLSVESPFSQETQEEIQDWKVLNRYDRNSSQERKEKIIQLAVKSEVRAQSNTVGRLQFFWWGDARVHPGGLLRLDPAFAYAEPPSS